MGYDLTKILVLGASGYIGFGIYTKLINNNYNCIETSKSKKLPFFKLNLLNQKKIQKLVKKIKPTLIIHCANNIPNQGINFYENYKITSNILKYSKSEFKQICLKNNDLGCFSFQDVSQIMFHN